MRKPEKCTDIFSRVMMADTAQSFVNDLDFMYSDEDNIRFERLRAYFIHHDIPIPILPDDDRTESVIKNMYRVWAALECNNLMCALLGTENKDD